MRYTTPFLLLALLSAGAAACSCAAASRHQPMGAERRDRPPEPDHAGFAQRHIEPGIGPEKL